MAERIHVSSRRCPRCPASSLSDADLHVCSGCGGTWIDEETLQEHEHNQPTAPLEWSVSTVRDGLPCGICRKPMEPLILFGMPVDRCQPHGVWFDKGELPKVLERSTPVALATNDTSIVVPADGTDVLFADVAVEVALTGLDVAVDAGPGVIEAILEVLGSIFSAIDL